MLLNLEKVVFAVLYKIVRLIKIISESFNWIELAMGLQDHPYYPEILQITL